MAEEKKGFGVSFGPYSGQFGTLSDIWEGLSDLGKEEALKRIQDLYKTDYAIGQFPIVQGAQSIEFQTPVGNYRPFVPPGQKPIPKGPPRKAGAKPKQMVQGNTEYTPPPGKPAPTAPTLPPAPTSEGLPDTTQPSDVTAIQGALKAGAPGAAPPLPSSPSAQAPGEGFGRTPPIQEKPGWEKALLALQPLAQQLGRREPETTRPYARAGYFEQQKEQEDRETMLRREQMAQDAAMSRLQAESEIRRQLESQQATSAMERERYQQEQAMARAQAEIAARMALVREQEHDITPEQAQAMGLPTALGGIPASAAASLASERDRTGATKEYYGQIGQERQATNDRLRLDAISRELSNPMAMLDPVRSASLHAEADAINHRLNPSAFAAGQAAGTSARRAQEEAAAKAAAQVPPAEGGLWSSVKGAGQHLWSSMFGGGEPAPPPGPTTPDQSGGMLPPSPDHTVGYNLSQQTRDRINGILMSKGNDQVGLARALAEAASAAGPDERIELQRFIADRTRK